MSVLAMTVHDVEWFMQNFANPLAAAALLGVTGYYAWTTRKILAANTRLVEETAEMVEETRRMADAAHQTYLASLAPRLEFENRGIQETATASVVRFKVINKGEQHVMLRQVQIVASGGDKLFWQFPEPPVVFPGAGHSVEAAFAAVQAAAESVLLEVSDIAGQRHWISPYYPYYLPKR